MDAKRRKRSVVRTVRHLLEKYREAGGDKARLTEAVTKKDYILPLFRSLGWDVESGEVTAEERVSRGFVDYGFKADNLPMFYLEAKGMNIKNMEQRQWMVQAVNYSWLKAVPWAILTNFRVLKVLNADAKLSTPASVQFFEIKCDDMLNPQTLDKLLLLSRESLVEGRLDRAAREWGAIGTTTPVDRRLYEDLFKAREMLMGSIIRNNTGLTRSDREESVERILSRLVFVRALEDRGLSEPILLPLVREAEDRLAAGRGAGRGGRRDVRIRDGMRRAFRRLDGIYDASLFAPHPCDRLDITDYTLTKVINMLYMSAEQLQRYDFGVLDVDILGGIYEQYLGAIAAGRAEGDAKGSPYRQSHGIYYTPSSIVGFMVDVLVRYLVEDGQDPDTMRVCDPSCGSGTFLVRCVREIAGARYKKTVGSDDQVHRYGGVADIPHNAMLRRMTVRTIEENVFGIDLDRTAVERARLNLFLCEVGRDTQLPNVHETVRLGNSLMGNGVPSSIEPNPFPWDLCFLGKFDGMIGNPPYIRNRRMSADAKEWFAKEYVSASGQYDAYVLFVEKALERVRDGGYVVFITSNKYAAAAYGAALRRHILKTARIRMIVDVSDTRVFPDPDVYPWIIVLQKESRAEKRRSNTMLLGRVGANSGTPSPYACKFARVPQSLFEDNHDNVFYVDVPYPSSDGADNTQIGAGMVGDMGTVQGAAVDTRTSRIIMDSLDKDDGSTIPMGSFTIRESVHTGNVRKKILSTNEGETNSSKKIIRGKDMGRYCHEWRGYWLDTEYELGSGEYMRINEPALFRGKKLFLRDIANRITACYDDSGIYSLNTLFVVRTDCAVDGICYDPLYVLAVLNSSLMSWYFAKKFGAVHVAGGYLRYKKQYVEKLPLRAVPPRRQAPIVGAVRELHRLVGKKRRMAGSEGTDRWREVDDAIRRQDEIIDGMVFRLYGIDDDTGASIRREVPDAAVRIGTAARKRVGGP